jgi:hypothetical protein
MRANFINSLLDWQIRFPSLIFSDGFLLNVNKQAFYGTSPGCQDPFSFPLIVKVNPDLVINDNDFPSQLWLQLIFFETGREIIYI